MRFNSDQIQKIGKEISNKVDGKTLFDEFSRGRYSTDASVYQIKPLGVVLPKAVSYTHLTLPTSDLV